MNFREFLKNEIVILDGGMGTLLQARGLMPGELPERWNINHPDIVRDIHKAYFEAGSNVVSTNTFGANCLKFSDGELEEIIKAAFMCARSAKESAKAEGEKFIALDIGPTGKLLKPYGDLDFEDAVTVFSKTVKIGAKCGADLIIIETMNDSYEAKAALLAAKESSDLPVIVTNAYGADGKLMTGASPEAMALMLEGMGADAIGANCSLGPRELKPVMEKLIEYCSVPVVMKPNAGLPTLADGQTKYNVSPKDFARDVTELVRKGVRVVGGCCGTTPEYIKALSELLYGITPLPLTEKNITAVSSYTHAVNFENTPVLIGERINPTGKKRLKEALLSNDMDYILGEAVSQQEKGVHILDVNVGLPGIDEAEMLTRTITEIQAVVNLPLQIDTANPGAMEMALRRYNGRALINSVSGKRESMDKIFPLVKKYGGTLIALTLDEDGIPDTAEGRVKIAKKILAEADKYGIKKNNIIFDTLAMTVSTGADAPKATLEALRIIRHELGVHTSLGVSNVSYGLPNRDAINATFFTMALSSGLSAAIMNPYSPDMMRVYYTYRVLSGKDENCIDYISHADLFPTQPSEVKGEEKKSEKEAVSELSYAIEKGFREKAALATKKLLLTENPLNTVEKEIIPALNKVGIGYENKTVYLPELLMSAEAAKAAFEVIKERLPKESGGKGPFVIATVEGDIHDIGKNIVKLLLENYGFSVIDLGRDVKPEAVLDAAKKSHAPIVGLSALMTTTLPSMQRTVKLLKSELPSARIVVGGAVLTKEYAMEIGADKYAKDAMDTVRYAEDAVSD